MIVLNGQLFNMLQIHEIKLLTAQTSYSYGCAVGCCIICSADRCVNLTL